MEVNELKWKYRKINNQIKKYGKIIFEVTGISNVTKKFRSLWLKHL